MAKPIGADAARMFKAMAAMLAGASDNEKLTLITNLSAFVIYNIIAGMPPDDGETLLKDFFHQVHASIITNAQYDETFPTVDEVLAGAPTQ